MALKIGGENNIKPGLRTAELDQPLASFSLFSKESGGGGSSGGATKSSVALEFFNLLNFNNSNLGMCVIF